MKKILALVLCLAMILMVGAAFAADPVYGTPNQAHTITVNSQGTGVHNYEAYQVFVGNLDAKEEKLTDIQWGSGVDGTALLTALKDDDVTKAAMANADSAAKVAEILGANGNNASFVEAFAKLVGANLTTTKAGTGASSGGNPNTATISVSGDGYYFVKDVTPTLTAGDTYSKFMLDVVKNVEVTAKDTAFKPDKNIRKANGEDFTHVKADSSAIGDVVTFDVDIIIPDTTNYIDHFIMNMQDTLPAGLTLLAVDSAVADGVDVPYTATAVNADDSAFTYPANAAAAVTTAGGQKLKIVFNGFKAFVENEEHYLIGKTLTVTYRAVVNDNAVFGPTGNENEVEYIYSNNPNHDYDGDEPVTGDPTGETPKDKTKTVVTQLKITKIANNDTTKKLAGAEFTVTGTAFNYVVKTGERFNEDPNGTYYKLLDGSYTETVPGSTVNGVVINDTQYASTTVKYSKEEFTEVEATPETFKHVGITDSNGVFQLSGLKPGTYTIEETHAPDGYNKITETKEIEITWELGTATNKDSGVWGLTAASEAAGFSMTGDGVIYEITINNNSGTELPSTGGIGTTIFYILGGLLVIGAAVILVARRKAQD